MTTSGGVRRAVGPADPARAGTSDAGSGSGARSGYSGLAERAVAFLESVGSPVTPEAVTAHLLGATAGTLGPLVATVSQTLAGDGRLVRTADGGWALAAWAAEDRALRDADFVVLAVRTTGGRSERHRVIEVAGVLVRGVLVRGGEPVAEYESLVNPGVPIRRFATDYTGITPELADEAPPAAEVLDELRAFAGDAVLVGHGIGPALAFLNYEAVWHGRAPFGNPVLDSQALALRLLPDVRRPDLDRTAHALGVSVGPHPRALPTARLNARVFSALLERADLAGIRTVAALRHFATNGSTGDAADVTSQTATGPDRRNGGGSTRAAAPLTRETLSVEALRQLPDEPGVYRFLDAAGMVLYVGKALSLRQRVPQHFTGTARAIRLDDGLIDRTVAVEHTVVDTELDALLEEARLIGELRPPFNVQREGRAGALFVRFEPGVFPRLAAVHDVGAIANGVPGDVLGPYRTSQEARRVIETVQRVFQIRSCRRVLPATRRKMRIPCLRLGQGLCPAPCARAVTPEQYGRLVDLARIYLMEGKQAAQASIERWLAAGPGVCDAWEVAILQETQRRLRRVRREHHPVSGGLAGDGVLLVERAPATGALVLYVVRAGRLVGRRCAPAEEVDEADIREWLEDLERGANQSRPDESVGDPELSMGQAILLRWVHRRSGAANSVALPRGGSFGAAVALVAACAPQPQWPGDDDEEHSDVLAVSGQQPRPS
ncbi:MAG TPA: exonuclease domain-containing protein [Chloroflexota bacterium]|nr:exonuclease domain-containing protein [Chloroflexota bacterium]